MSQSSEKKYPFILGTTSYIIQADIVTNVQYLSKYVEDVELVLFETEQITNIPSSDEIQQLREIHDRTGIGYTVHFPIDNKAGSSESDERIAFSDSAKKLIDLTLPLSPRAWILHLEGIKPEASNEEVDAWKNYTRAIIEELTEKVKINSDIAIENLGYPWYWHLDNAAQAGTSLCCDIGHLCLYFKGDWKTHFEIMLPHTSVIHLHGVSGENDHISLKYHDRDQISNFFEIIKKTDYKGVITLEIFSERELFESLKIVDEIWNEC
jgi:sugar phosphate isomerase/epimerase